MTTTSKQDATRSGTTVEGWLYILKANFCPLDSEEFISDAFDKINRFLHGKDDKALSSRRSSKTNDDEEEFFLVL